MALEYKESPIGGFMRIELARDEIERDHGLEIAVRGFKGDYSVFPAQVFLEVDNTNTKKPVLKVYVWNGEYEDPAHTLTVDAL